MKKQKKLDYLLLINILALLSIGLLMVASVSSVKSQEEFHDPFFFVKKALLYTMGLGIPFLIFGSKVNYRTWHKFSLLFLLGTLFLLILVFVPGIGFGYGGAMRWINIGGMSLQPSEITKLFFIIYLSAWLARQGKNVKNFKEGVLPFLFATGAVSILILLQPDVGTLGIITISAGFCYFLAGARFRHSIYIILIGLILLGSLIKLAPYRMARLKAFLDPTADPQGIGYQSLQAKIALGSGGFYGLGLGESGQKFNFLPEAMGDAIFAITGEEFGFIGTFLIIILFLHFAFRGILISSKIKDLFGKLLAASIVLWITTQAFINMAAITGLVPLTGIPLPFISYGGTAFVTTMFASGILLNISRYAQEK